MKTERNYLRNILIILIFTCLIYVLMAFLQDFDKIRQSFDAYKFENFFYAFLIITQTWLIEALMLKLVVGRIKAVSFRHSLRIALITHFFNLITPFYTGGQPFTVYYYGKEGIAYEKSIAAIVFKSYTFQIAISVLGVFSLLISYHTLSSLMFYVALTGIVVNSAMAFIIFFIGKSRRFGEFVIHVLFKLLNRIRLIKNPDQLKLKVKDKVLEFNDMFVAYGNQKGLFFKLIGLNLLNYGLYALSAVVILNGIGVLPTVDVFNRTVMLNISSSFVPTPGTTGGIEGMYFLFFNGMAANTELTLGVLLWRIASYYISITVTGLFVFDAFRKRNRTEAELS